MSRVQRLKLENFKAFERFSVDFGSQAFLVGPNNAGKSTLISALRTAAYMLRHASSRSPETLVDDEGRQFPGFAISQDAFGLMTENLRHEFRQEPARIEVHFTNRARLVALWPVIPAVGDAEYESEEEEEGAESVGYFYLLVPNGNAARRPTDVRRAFRGWALYPFSRQLSTTRSS